MTQDRIALITGGNRGLGRAAALALGESGVDLILTYRGNKDEAAAVVDALVGNGRKAVALQLDTTDFEAFPAFASGLKDALRTTWSRESFDYLVNNAGSSANTPVGQTSVEDIDLMYEVHFKGVLLLTQELLPVLADGGRILNVSTGLTRFVGPGRSVYAAMKSAVETYTRYLAQELGPRGITANVIAPGPVATDFGNALIRDNDDLRAMLGKQAALGRVGEAEDIGPVVAALLAPGTGWITGQRIEASGGSHL